MNLSFSKFNALQMRSSMSGWSIIQTTDQTKEIMYTNDGGVNWYKKTPSNVKVVAADFIDSTITDYINLLRNKHHRCFIPITVGIRGVDAWYLQ